MLSEREKRILDLREKKVPFRTMQKEFNISHNRIWQIYKNALRKIRIEDEKRHIQV